MGFLEHYVLHYFGNNRYRVNHNFQLGTFHGLTTRLLRMYTIAQVDLEIQFTLFIRIPSLYTRLIWIFA